MVKAFPRRISIRDKYEPAMEIVSQAEADEYFGACVRHGLWLCTPEDEPNVDAAILAIPTKAVKEIIDSERRNIGYYAGYFDEATRERVFRLFKTEHPIFGKACADGGTR